MERFCTNCDAPLSETAKFCANCGIQVPALPVQPIQTVKRDNGPSIADNELKPTSVKRTEKRTIIGIVTLTSGAFGMGVTVGNLLPLHLSFYAISSILGLILTFTFFAAIVVGSSLIIMKER